MIGATFPVFIGITVILIGGAGFLMGQALARSWRPIWQVVGYGLLLGIADRFLIFALFEGTLVTLAGYAIDCVVILALALIGYRTTLAAKMVSQYPWLYRRAGPFSWRPRGG